MKMVFLMIVLLLTACGAASSRSDGNDGNGHSAVEPAHTVKYPDEGVSFEWGGSITIDSYAIHKKEGRAP